MTHDGDGTQRRGRTRTATWIVTVGGLLLLVAALAAGDLGNAESEKPGDLGTRLEVGKIGPSPVVTQRFAEPQNRVSAERQAVAASAAGEAFDDPADSERLAATIARLRAEPAPVDEIFALVKVTDRETGERRMFTRGKADPRFGEWIADPASAPPGSAYFESESGRADGGVEIVVRSVFAQERKESWKGPTPEEEKEMKLRERNEGSGFSYRIERRLRDILADRDESSDELIPVTIELRSVPALKMPKAADPLVGGLILAGLDIAAERQRVLIHRKQEVRRLQGSMTEAIEAGGGRVGYASWMSGSIQAELPAKAIAGLAEHPDLLSIEHAPRELEEWGVYMRDDIFIATNAHFFDAFHPGFHGVFGKHPYTSRVVIGQSEECIDVSAPAWLTLGPGSMSRARFFDIDPFLTTLGGLETCWTTDPANPMDHGNAVAGMMVADFMDGQDPDLSAIERRRLTGTCPECLFLFAQDQPPNQRNKAHDWACEHGVDIFQSSLGLSGISCTGNGPWDASIQALINCNAVYVAAAGNLGSTGGCSTGYPADHPWIFTVGGMKSSDDCDTPGEYYTSTCDYDDGASKGGATYDGMPDSASVIDLTAPYCLNHVLVPGTANPTERKGSCGTSLSCPIVAGLMAEMMDWWRVHISSSIFYGNRMRNYMLLFGDRSAFDSGVLQWVVGTDKRWGAGRVGLVPFDHIGGWSIFRASAYLFAGQSHTFFDPSAEFIDFYKVAVWHDGTDYSSEPILEVVADPYGCDSPTRYLSVLDNKAVMMLRLDNCLGVHITVKNVPGGWPSSRRFHVGTYGHTGSTERFF